MSVWLQSPHSIDIPHDVHRTKYSSLGFPPNVTHYDSVRHTLGGLTTSRNVFKHGHSRNGEFGDNTDDMDSERHYLTSRPGGKKGCHGIRGFNPLEGSERQLRAEAVN